MVNTWDPDLILTLGDNYHLHAGGTGADKYDFAAGQYYCSFMKDVTTTGTACPAGQAAVNRFFPALGDHDYEDAGTTDNLPVTYTDYFRLPGEGYTSSSNNERYYDFVSGPVHFFILNGVEQPGYEPDGTDQYSIQAQWLRSALGASTSTWNVVVVHKPPYSSGIKHGGAEHMQWPFAQWGADVVFSGHEHTYERILRDGIVYFVNGLGGDWIYDFGPPTEGSAARYNASHGAQRVLVTDRSMTFEFYSIENGGTLQDTYTITVPHNTATPTLPLMETGWQSPGGQVAPGSGDGNGYEVNPTYAFADDGLAAIDMDSGVSPSTSCADSGMDKHKFYDYHIPIPADTLVQGIRVRLDASADSTVGAPKLCVAISWDGGVSWSPWKSSPTIAETEESYFLGGASDTWAHPWTWTEVSNPSFQVRVANTTGDNNRDFSLDWVAVNVLYVYNPEVTGTSTHTATTTLKPTATDTATASATSSPTMTVSPTSTPTVSSTPTDLSTSTQTGTSTATATSTASNTPTPTATASGANIRVMIGSTQRGTHSILRDHSLQVSYRNVNDGPIKIASTNLLPILGSERVIYRVNNLNTSFTEIMALPNRQLDSTYWLPWYNNVELDTQLRFANVSGSLATVHVYIGGVEMQGSPFTLLAGQSTRKSFAGVNNGPVQIVSDYGVPIVAAERLIYKVNNLNTSFTEMMALPDKALDTTYWLPWYNNVELDTQLRFANVTDETATVHVYVGGDEMQGSPFTLLPGASTRKSFAGVNAGPVQIVSDHGVPIVAAERLIYKANGVATSFTEMMALPASQLDTTYWLPWYNNTAGLDTQLRFANVHDTQTATVHVYIGGVEMQGSPFTLLPGESTRKSFANINTGPVRIVSDVPIVAAQRLIYRVNNVPTSFSEMMALPHSQLDTLSWLPWYNNVDLDTQLRFGVP
jgi:hypothetical protein